MKKTATIYMLMLAMLSSIHVSAQKKAARFEEVNLSKLRSTVLNQLSKDQLIESKKDRVYLFLRDDAIYLNETALDQTTTERYRDLVAPFRLGTGTHLAVFISPGGTGIGDFRDRGFHGKFSGRLTKEDTDVPASFNP